MFPGKNARPENITFHHQNFLEPFPDEYLGAYDVVNVRLMVVALSYDEWEPAVHNLMTLLSTNPPSSDPSDSRSNLPVSRAGRAFSMD